VPTSGISQVERKNVKLLIQPGDGIQPLIEGINRATSSVEIVIFRFDRGEIERALANAVSRGLSVHALIAYTNRGGEQGLRKLEMRLLAAGVTVARTANDLARYHDKFMIVDRRELYVLAFNYTYLDIEHSRSFGVITRNQRLVQEAVRLFEADVKRQPYKTRLSSFVVSPVNARKALAAYLKGAKKELRIYDPEISDPDMMRILEERAAAGVDIQIIGKLGGGPTKLTAHKLAHLRLHTRSVIRDGLYVFLGSQSLREIELDRRREVGVILRDRKMASRLLKIFAEDWAMAQQYADRPPSPETPIAKVARKVAKAVAKELPPVAPVVEVVVKEMAGGDPALELDPREVEETVKDAVKEAVREAVKDVVKQVTANHNNGK
jgi:phosphatidylserine/phosphatidylglycerophosphate/cardiolipin synthase-like enzyme